jgi:hypothetical protein
VFTRLDFAVVGSLITDGKNLKITYNYLLNPDIKYSTSSRSVGGSLSFLDRRYTVFADYFESKQDLLAGQADLLILINQVSYDVGISSDFDNFSSGLKYAKSDSEQDRQESVYAHSRFNYNLETGSIMFQANDTYTRYGKTVYRPTEHTENVFNTGLTYTRPFAENSLLTITSNYTSVSGGSIGRDNVSLGINYQISIGKLAFTVSGKTIFEKLGSTTYRNDNLHMQLSRYF